MALPVPEKWDRPSWWGPEAVLERLQRGELVGAICEQGSLETGCDVRARTLRADITKWSQSLSFGEQFQAALKLWRNGAREREISKEWWTEFFDTVVACGGSVPRACEQFGVGVELVEALRDKRNKVYSAEFTEGLRIAEGVRIARIRENVLTQAEQATVDGAKIGQKVLESAMPGLHAARQQIEVTGDVKHDHTFRLAPEVIAAQQARFSALNVGRTRAALESGDREVIDVVPEPVRQKA